MENKLTKMIYEQYEYLSKTEKKIADFVLREQQTIPYKTLAQFAAECSTSEPSVMRFIKKFGFMSYTDFKREILKYDIQVKQKRIMYDQDYIADRNGSFFKKGNSFTYMATCLGDQIASMCQQLVRTIELKQIWEVIQIMTKAGNIDLYGVGYSGNVANEFMYRLVKLGLNCRAYREDSWIQIGRPIIAKGDVAIAFSYSGETISTVEALRHAKEVGANTVGVTSDIESQLGKEAEMVIVLPKVSSELVNFSMATCVGQMLITDILYLGIFSADWDRFMAAWKKFTLRISE